MEPLPFSQLPTAGNIITSAFNLTRPDFHRKVYEMGQELGGIFKIPAPPPNNTIVAVTDPKILQEITAEEFSGVTKPPRLYKTFAVLCSNAKPEPTYPLLATADEKAWATIRDGFAAAFAPGAVEQYLPVLDAEATKVLSQVSAGEVDILELVGRISLSTTGRVMFGYDAFECTDLRLPATFWKEVITARKGAVDAARSPLLRLEQHYLPFRPGPQVYSTSLDAVYKKYEEIYSHLDDPLAAARPPTNNPGVLPTILGAFGTTRAPHSLQCGTAGPRCPMHVWGQSNGQSSGEQGGSEQGSSSEPMRKEDTIATIGNFVVAGTLPAATAAAYTLCLIACHTEVQATVYAELRAAGLDQGRRPFTAADPAQLPYLTHVIKEAMRVNPTVPQVNRETSKDLVLGGYLIPKGTLLFLSIGGMHTSPFNFTEPARFWPERWAGEAVAGGDAKYPQASSLGNLGDLEGSFTPFSQGPRACLGQHWARLAILATVASVVSRFELLSPRSMSADSLAAGETFSISCYPKTPLMLTLKPRTA